jgi:adenine-specific DNA-methyltransferase
MRFVVETSPKVVQRCVLMTTDPGDLVLDPTCGSGTTSYVSERWGRRWITIDSSRVALALTRERLASAVFPYFVLADSPEGQTAEAELIGGPVSTAPTQRNVRHGFVYQRALHLTLGAIANNPDIRPGMSRDEVARAIRRHADYEPLFDQPVQDSSKVRVAGPFTVETLSPHRALATGGSPWSLAAGDGHASSNENGRFEEIIRDNLAASGIQNGRRSERLTFDTVSPYAASHIQFVGEREQVTDGGPRRAGISVGPQYGTVGPSFIKEAAREAIRAQDIDLLCVLAFAFDPSVLGTGDDYVTSDEGFAEVAAERQLGRVPVLLVRMNADLVMGQDLKTAPNANLFTVFGEPDVDVLREGELLRVVLHGVDVYDPNTGELRSRSTDRIALWMIDSDYNGESFFVRHCYFTGGNDPYAKLKRALRAEIDEAAWSSLYRTESLPFDRPETGKIAVKVINDYGDEVVKVIAV